MSQQNVTVLSGSSRGLGLAMAKELATGTGHLITLSRQRSSELAEIAAAHSVRLDQIVVDLADPVALKDAASLLATALTHTKNASSYRIIHNAGIVTPIKPANDLTEFNEIRQAFDVNIAAPIFLTAHFLNATAQCADRRVMLISSGAGRNPTGSWGVYCATKAAMDHYSNVLNAEQHPNLRTSSVAPGVIDTGMQIEIRSTPADKFPSLKRFTDMHDNGVLANASDTAHKLLKLLGSDEFGQKTIDDVRNH